MALNINNSLGPVKDHVRPVAEEIDERWDMYNIWGVGGSQDHLLGLALDFMLYTQDGRSIRTEAGNEIAAWFVQHSNRLNVSYVIWRQRIWNPSRDPAGASWDNWRRMEDRGDPTQNHMDHVHVSFKPTGVYTPPANNEPTPVAGNTTDVIYVVKAGDTLTRIAQNHDVTVAQLVGWNNITNVDIINVGQRLIVGKVITVPTIKLSETGPGKSAANNKVVQQALRNEYGTVVVDGDWGPQTTSYYSRWQNSLGFTGSDADGLPGRTSLTALGRKYNFIVDLEETPEPPAPEEPTVPTVGGTVRFNYVGPGTRNDDNKIVQKSLNYEFGGVVIDGDWGPQTSGAYTRWQQKLGFSGSDADGAPGRTSMNALATKYKFTVNYTATPPTSGEPAHNYSRTTWSGKTINIRTRDMLREAERLSGQSIRLTQGSYNRGGVAASAGTHDGGGVVDIASSSTSLVQALRKAGFAAWLRTPAQGFAYHIHACAIGDREMAQGAKNQVQAYFNGRDGLARNGADTNPPRPWPAWANKYNY